MIANPQWNRQFSRFELVTRSAEGSRGLVQVGALTIGGGNFAVIAGICAVESQRQILETAEAVAAAGADELLVEVHPAPEPALSDAMQPLTFGRFEEIMRDLRRYVRIQPSLEDMRPQVLAAGGAS